MQRENKTATAGCALLRIPPFPGAKISEFAVHSSRIIADPPTPQACIDAIRRLRVEGEYWRTRPQLPDSRQRAQAAALPVETAFANPFTGAAISLLDVIELSGFFRAMIDSNRDLGSSLGLAFWKQATVAPLLWGGEGHLPALRSASEARGRPVAVWKAKAPPELLAQLERDGTLLVEVEDGFLRSNGLGADCIPPLSITVDRLGAHFDPAQPSELENLLQFGDFAPLLLARARQLRKVIVAAGLGKYETGGAALDRLHPTKRHILVPGQVEDDRSVMTGGGGMTNLTLLERVRADSPDAFIIYKPHPDVLAGHRKGDIPAEVCHRLADAMMPDAPISSLIDMVDAVHVNTSLAGFEALMRDTPVTAHGVPFYAGWGLTDDRGAVPPRRNARRSLDELVAATLLLYPRYLDPVTGLPCPAEVVVDRLSAPGTAPTGTLIALRRLQGRVRRQWQRVWH